MPIRAVENRRLYRQIADQLSSLIASHEFAEGARLPSERDLAVQLGVSRPSVREALIALEIEGKVEVRVGAGIYVVPQRLMPVADPTSEGQGPFELLRARWLIEGEVAAEAARNAEEQDIEAVRAAFDDMHRRQRQQIDADPADRDFHIGIAKGTHNSALVNVVRDLWDKGRGAIWRRMEVHFQTPELRAASLRDHRVILAALEKRDSRASRSAMRMHLQRVDTEFNRGWDQLKERELETPPRPKKDAAAGLAGSIRRVPGR
ncbi:MAG: FadR/GntR family transcriptional regulator [Polyangiaceae bacterium]